MRRAQATSTTAYAEPSKNPQTAVSIRKNVARYIQGTDENISAQAYEYHCRIRRLEKLKYIKGEYYDK